MNVAVTMRIVQNNTYFEERDCISNDYINFLQEYGLNPVLIPNTLKNPIDYLLKMNCRGLILTGGDDILISCEEVLNKNIIFRNNRDKTEYILLDYCIKNQIPILGICRGMQFINLYFENKVKKLNGDINHVNVNHEVIINEDFINEFKYEKFKVNSYHNCGVYENDFSNKIDWFAKSSDNIIEGIYKEKAFIGIQWHIERSVSKVDKIIMNLFKNWMI